MPGRRTTPPQASPAEDGQAGRRKRTGAAASLERLPSGLPMLRTSERGTLKGCEWRWDLEFNRRIKPQVSMPALRFGTLAHTAMAGWYVPGVKRGVSPVIGFERAYLEEQAYVQQHFGARDEDGTWIDALELGVAMMENYLDEYGKDDLWEVLVTEKPFQVVVNDPDTDEPWFIYTGILDGVWRNRSTKDIWIPDHKTTAGIGDSKLNYLVLDDQAGAYWSWGVDYLAKEALLTKNQRLNGMLYNFLRKQKPDERPSKFVNGKRLYLNNDGSVSKKQPSPYFLRQPIFRDDYDRGQAKRRALIDMRRIEMLRAGELEITKNPGMFTCPGCWARDACELHETGGDFESFLKDSTRPWDPYAEHEVRDGR